MEENILGTPRLRITIRNIETGEAYEMDLNHAYKDMERLKYAIGYGLGASRYIVPPSEFREIFCESH